MATPEWPPPGMSIQHPSTPHDPGYPDDNTKVTRFSDGSENIRVKATVDRLAPVQVWRCQRADVKQILDFYDLKRNHVSFTGRTHDSRSGSSYPDTIALFRFVRRPTVRQVDTNWLDVQVHLYQTEL